MHTLLGKSLVRVETMPTGEQRFTMLQTIREYALEQLEASGEVEQLRRQHALYYLALSEEGWLSRSPESRSPDDGTRVQRIDREYHNLRAALAWSQTSTGDPEIAVRLTRTLEDLWLRRSARNEAMEAIERTLNHPLGIGRTVAQVELRANLAELFAIGGDFTTARVQFEEVLPLARELGQTQQCARILERLGWVAREQGDCAAAWQYLTEILALCRELGDVAAAAGALTSMAGIAILEEDPARAEALLAENMALAQQREQPHDAIFWRLHHLGQIAQLRGEYNRAAHYHQKCLAHLEPYRTLWGAHVSAYHSIGESALGLGDLADALRWLARGLATAHKLGERQDIAWCLASLGSAAALDAEPDRAARLWGAAERLRQSIGCRRAPASRATYERAMASTPSLVMMPLRRRGQKVGG